MFLNLRLPAIWGMIDSEWNLGGKGDTRAVVEVPKVNREGNLEGTEGRK